MTDEPTLDNLWLLGNEYWFRSKLGDNIRIVTSTTKRMQALDFAALVPPDKYAVQSSGKLLANGLDTLEEAMALANFIWEGDVNR